MAGCQSLATKSSVDSLKFEIGQLESKVTRLQSELGKKLNTSERDTIIQAGGLAGVALITPKLRVISTNLNVVKGVANSSANWIGTSGKVVQLKTATNAGKIASNTGTIRTVSNSVTSVAKKAASNAGQIAKLLPMLALLAVLQATLIAVQKRVDKNRQGIEDLNQSFSRLTTLIAKNKKAIAENKALIEYNERIIEINNRAIINNNRDIARNERDINQANNDINAANISIRAAQSKIANLTEEVTQLESQIENTEALAESADSKATAGLEEARDAGNRVSQLEYLKPLVANTIKRIEDLTSKDNQIEKKADTNTDGLVVVRRALGKVTTSQNQLDVKVAGVTSKVTNFSTNPNNVTNPGSSTNTRQLTEFNAQLETLKNTQAEQAKKLENLGKQKPVDTKQFEGLQRQIGDLPSDITTSLLAGLTPTLTTLSDSVSPDALKNAANDAICKSTGKNGCMTNNVLRPLQKGQRKLLDEFDLLGLGNLAGQLGDLALLDTINTKLGKEIPGGISGFMQKAWSFTKMDKILNVMNLAVNLHNATMLSRNIGETLGDAVSNALSAIGIKDAEGDAIDVNDVISQGITNLITGIIGTANYEALLTRWAKANRIYEVGTNLLSNVQSMLGSMEEITEQTGVDVSRIGNALRDSGTVESDSYEYMSEERRGFTKVFDALEKGEELADSFLNITSEIRDFTEEVQDFRENKQELEELIKEEISEVNRIEERADKRIEELPVPTEADKVQS